MPSGFPLSAFPGKPEGIPYKARLHFPLHLEESLSRRVAEVSRPYRKMLMFLTIITV
jgi:hypothetical protein